MKRFTLTFLFLLTLTSPVRAEQVCSVHDGDTFKLCTGQSIRVWGIDSPELKQPMGYKARDYLRSLIAGKDVTLHCKGKSHKRKICWVWAGDTYIQQEMVIHGWAYDSVKYSGGAFANEEARAKGKHLGVWQLPDGGQRPWDWRKAPKSQAL